MTAEGVFSVANFIAAGSWLLLIIAGRVRWVTTAVTGAVIPLLLGVLYTTLIVTRWGDSTGGFGSLRDVRELFANDWLLLAGWVHYLAFDLFVGSWQVRDAQKHGIPHWMLVPSLILTFLFGPTGLLVYALVRLARVRSFTLNT